MFKPLFPTFRMPAYDLPNSAPVSGSLKVVNLSNPRLLNPQTLPKTSGNSIKSSISYAKPTRPTSSSACQADFQEELQIQLEKEILTEPTMHFLQVSDLEPAPNAPKTADSYLKYPEASNKFLTIEEISLSNPVQQFTVKPRPQSVGKQGKSEKKVEFKPEKIEEKVETADFFRKIVEEKLRVIEEETLKLEEDMKTQNEQLDRLDFNVRQTAEREIKEYAAEYIGKITKDDELYEQEEEGSRVNKILANNQLLYERIQRVFTPKINLDYAYDQEVNVEEQGKEIGEHGRVTGKPGLGGNPIINKRIAAAMNTATRAIEVSRTNLKPAVLKKVRK